MDSSSSDVLATGIDKLAKALVALQSELKPVDKSAVNPFFKSKYAPLPEVMEAVQPLLAKHKLAVSQFMTSLNEQSALRTILIHESGQTLQDVTPLLLTKQDPQGQGSAVTYARRYGLMSVLGLVADEDDDGNAASARSSAPAPKKTYDNPSPLRTPTKAQLDLAVKLLEEGGYSDESIKQRMAQVKTSSDASELIENLMAAKEAKDGS